MSHDLYINRKNHILNIDTLQYIGCKLLAYPLLAGSDVDLFTFCFILGTYFFFELFLEEETEDALEETFELPASDGIS